MYQIYADGCLIYDGTTEEYKIFKGSGTLEINKAGSFTFGLYPDHPYFDAIVKLRTVIVVRKSGKILFRGRALNESVDKLKRKTITCEGELNFLRDSIIRPYQFTGTPDALFAKYISEHNSQVDEFKRFVLGNVTVIDPNDYVARENSAYEDSLENLKKRLLESDLSGYLWITHGSDGTEETPTIHYLSDFTKISTQHIEFGSNLKDFLKKSDAAPIATALIPLGAEVDDGDPDTDNPRLTISSVNNGLDYIAHADAVAAYGFICKPVEFDDVTVPANLLEKGKAYLKEAVKETVSAELTALDLHLLNREIEALSYGEYIRCVSTPHNFAETLLCTKQTFDLLKPQTDTFTLGYAGAAFTACQASSSALASAAMKSAAIAGNLSTVAQGSAAGAVSAAAQAAADAAAAKTNAQNAASSASSAQTNASAAAADASAAKTNAQNAASSASSAQTNASAAAADAAAAKTNAQNAASSASSAQANASAAAADAADAEKAAANAEAIAKDISEKTAAYRIAEQEMTSLLAKSFGVFKTEELQSDGSTIHYMHDKPTLAASTNIWKMTGDVFAVSFDGGATWSAGMDTTGNAIMNVLSVIGIDASWINAENLSAISAQIGGWTIKDNALFCELTESSKGYIYRVWIRPPDGAVSYTDWETQNFIDIEVSTNNGVSFDSLCHMSGADLRFEDAGGSYGMMSWGGFSAGDGTSGYTSMSAEGVDLYVSGWRRAYMRNFSGTTEILADQVRSGDGHSGSISLGGIVFVFEGGILTNAYYG